MRGFRCRAARQSGWWRATTRMITCHTAWRDNWQVGSPLARGYRNPDCRCRATIRAVANCGARHRPEAIGEIWPRAAFRPLAAGNPARVCPPQQFWVARASTVRRRWTAHAHEAGIPRVDAGCWQPLAAIRPSAAHSDGPRIRQLHGWRAAGGDGNFTTNVIHRRSGCRPLPSAPTARTIARAIYPISADIVAGVIG